MRLKWQFAPLWAPSDGAGAAAAAGAQGGAGAAAGAAAAGAQGGAGAQTAAGAEGAAAGQQSAATPFRPEGLPDHLAGKSDQETIERLFKAYEPLRADMAKRELPKDPKDYAFTPDPKIATYFANADDPMMAAAKTAAHKHGIPQAAFEGFLNDTFAPMVDAGVLAPVFDPQAEVTELGKMMGANGAPAPKDQVAAALLEAESFATGLSAQLKLPDAAKGALVALADTAAGTVVLRSIKAAFAERGLQLGGAPAQTGALTKEQLKAMDSDPRVDFRSPKFDPEFRRQYDEAYKRLHG